MAIDGIKRRVARLEAKASAQDQRILALIAAGAYYDELTDEEKREYERYKESLGGGDPDLAAARLNEMFYKMDGVKGIDDTPPEQFYHFRLTKKRPQPTPEEHAARVKEVERIFLDLKEEYNSPEEKAKREAEYRELQEIGELRGQAFARGEPMDSIPLPWEKGYKKPEYYKAKTPERK